MNIKDKLHKIDKDHFRLLADIGDVAKKENLKTYLVGGMVRDLLLGYDNLDIDITVENNAYALVDALLKAFPNCKLSAKHDRFYTAKVIFNVNGQLIPIDLASTREEIYKHPAALPDVRVSELKKDLIRRDFTINALAVSLLPHDFGDVVDLFNGLEDLKNKKIKILHDKSFIDDPTRMIRAVRFAEKLDFTIEENTKRLLDETINSKQFDNLIEKIRGDRVKIEIRYLFNLPNIEKAVKAFFESGIYKMISTTLNLYSSLLSLQPSDLKTQHSSPNSQWLIVLAIVLKDLESDLRKKIMNNLQLAGDEIDTIEKAYLASNSLKTLVEQKKDIDSIVIYKELKNLSLESILILKYLLNPQSSILNPLIDEYLNVTSKIKLEITGYDLKQLGFNEGKAIGETLQKVLEKKIKSPSMTKEDELNLAKSFKI